MKTIQINLLVLLFTLTACVSSGPRQPAQITKLSQLSHQSEVVDLSDRIESIPNLTKLKNLFNPNVPVSAEALKKLLSNLSEDESYSKMLFEYSSQTMKILKAPDVFEWMSNNPEVAMVLKEYIDPQEMDENDEPIWKATNRNLRNSMPLTASQSDFLVRMEKGLSALPTVKAISYRGASLRKEDVKRYIENTSVVEKSFLSTSIDPRIALRFSEGDKEVATVFIVKGQSGRPVSFIVPENIHEAEVLYKASSSFTIERTVKSDDGKNLFVFMVEK